MTNNRDATSPQKRASPAEYFVTDAFRATPLRAGDIAALQDFFDANPEYFIAVTGRPPRPNEAAEEFHELPPPDMRHSERFLIRLDDGSGGMIGMAGILSDLLAEGVWHIGLFIVATSLHGSGAAQGLYRALEDWMRGKGAQWVRLGVVAGNARAERFWESAGFVELRRRTGIEMGDRINTIRVMAKPLAGGTRDEYLARVARDRPEQGDVAAT